MSYTPTGPFQNGTAPGISSSFLNNMESFLVGVNSGATDSHISAVNGILTTLGLASNPTPVVVNGTTAGTATLYEVLSGSVKLCFLTLLNYQNNTSTQQTLALPTPMTFQTYIVTGATPFLQPFKAGSAAANTSRVWNTINNAGGSATVQNSISNWSIGVFTAGLDALGLGVTQSVGTSGIAFLIGV